MCPDLLDLLALPDLNHPNFLVSLDHPGLPKLGPIKLLKKNAASRGSNDTITDSTYYDTYLLE